MTADNHPTAAQPRATPDLDVLRDVFSIDLAEYACAVRDTVRSLNGPARDAALAWEDESREQLLASRAALLDLAATYKQERDEAREACRQNRLTITSLITGGRTDAR